MRAGAAQRARRAPAAATQAAQRRRKASSGHGADGLPGCIPGMQGGGKGSRAREQRCSAGCSELGGRRPGQRCRRQRDEATATTKARADLFEEVAEAHALHLGAGVRRAAGAVGRRLRLPPPRGNTYATQVKGCDSSVQQTAWDPSILLPNLVVGWCLTHLMLLLRDAGPSAAVPQGAPGRPSPPPLDALRALTLSCCCAARKRRSASSSSWCRDQCRSRTKWRSKRACATPGRTRTPHTHTHTCAHPATLPRAPRSTPNPLAASTRPPGLGQGVEGGYVVRAAQAGNRP